MGSLRTAHKNTYSRRVMLTFGGVGNVLENLLRTLSFFLSLSLCIYLPESVWILCSDIKNCYNINIHTYICVYMYVCIIYFFLPFSYSRVIVTNYNLMQTLLVIKTGWKLIPVPGRNNIDGAWAIHL